MHLGEKDRQRERERDGYDKKAGTVFGQGKRERQRVREEGRQRDSERAKERKSMRE